MSRLLHLPALLLLVLLLAPGCILTSAANRLSDTSVPEQDATVADVSSESVRVVIRVARGSREVSETVLLPEIGPVVTASVARDWHRTQGWSPFAIFEKRMDHESLFVVTGKDALGKSQSVDLSILAEGPNGGEKVASYALMPLGFLVDLATFPLEWLGLAVYLMW